MFTDLIIVSLSYEMTLIALIILYMYTIKANLKLI